MIKTEKEKKWTINPPGSMTEEELEKNIKLFLGTPMH